MLYGSGKMPFVTVACRVQQRLACWWGFKARFWPLRLAPVRLPGVGSSAVPSRADRPFPQLRSLNHQVCVCDLLFYGVR